VTVRVGTLPDGCFVKDDGVGIPEADREAIFEPGFSTSDGGTGFGMVSVRQIALAHGWAVTVTDGTAGGARFAFTDVERPWRPYLVSFRLVSSRVDSFPSDPSRSTPGDAPSGPTPSRSRGTRRVSTHRPPAAGRDESRRPSIGPYRPLRAGPADGRVTRGDGPARTTTRRRLGLGPDELAHSTVAGTRGLQSTRSPSNGRGS
jgi:hypothetical protein